VSSVATRVIPYFYNKTTDMPKQKNIDELVENEITGTAKELRKALTTVKAPASNKSKLLSSGFAPLNLASTNCHHGFIAPGEDCIIFGDSASGKTWLYLQILAEAANNPNFDEYRLIVDNSENGIGMDIERFFGKKLAERLEPPSYDSNDEPFNSETVEDFYYHLDDALKQKKPFIYVMDSITSLSSVADDDKFDENKKIHLDKLFHDRSFHPEEFIRQLIALPSSMAMKKRYGHYHMCRESDSLQLGDFECLRHRLWH